jgi:hypothetical protein
MPEGHISQAPAARLTPRRVPEPYVRAEIATFPLTSPEAFESRITVLDPTLEEGDIVDRDVTGDARERPTRALWRACEERLVPHAGGWSLDRLVAARDYTWFTGDDEGGSAAVPMHRYLRHLAHIHVEKQRGLAEVHREEVANELDALAHYRWLSFSVPEDLLLAAVAIQPPPKRVELENVLLMRGLVDRGVAEVHQHVGAGVDFPLLWAGVLAALANPELAPDAMVGPGAPLGGRNMLRWLVAAALVRIALMEFLLSEQHRGDHETFRDFLGSLRRRGESRGAWLYGEAVRLVAACKALVVAPKAGPPEFEPLRALYARWHPAGCQMGAEPPRSVDEAWQRCDPIAVRLRLRSPSAGERWLVCHALSYLEECERAARPDPWFETLFWQVVRLRCIYYRHIVQRPLTSGLQWFIRYYGHIGELRGPLTAVRPEAAFQVAGELAGRSEKVAALEVRVGIGDTAPELGEQLRTMMLSWQGVLDTFGRTDYPEFGVVAHFIKERDQKRLWRGGRPEAFGAGTHAEPPLSLGRPRPDQSFCSGDGPRLPVRTCEVRFGDYLDRITQNAVALGGLLCAVPLALWLLRGIDVATDELGVPTWVLVPIYRYVRQEAAFASVLPGAGGAPTVRTTAHVGEDFRHLMEGMRRIFEAVRYLLASNGSRLGHATALGVDPRVWAESVGALLMPREERLWDLVFEWRLYSCFHVPPEFLVVGPAGRQAQLSVQIRELARDIYGDADETLEAVDLAQLHHDLHAFMIPGVVRDLVPGDISVARGLNRVRRDPAWRQSRRAERLERYLVDAAVFKRGQELIDVPLNEADVGALTAVQDAVRRGVAACGIVVEINPTSNLLIGDMLDLRNHPILRLFPIDPETGPPPVRIAIGSDDPVTFNTSLLREYALLYHAARAAGHSDRMVQAWLDTVRKTSMDARFTVPWRPDAPTQARRLVDCFNRYLHRPRTRDSYAATADSYAR